jgi:hypothetical protein
MNESHEFALDMVTQTIDEGSVKKDAARNTLC